MATICPDNLVTTYRKHFKPLPAGNFPVKASKIAQRDVALLSNQFHNTLQVNGIQQKSKIWPETTFGVEEYKDYLQRFECCKNEIYKLYFRCPEVKPELIEQMLKDLEKSTYQYVHSPNEFVTRNEARRFTTTALQNSNMKYYATTYGTYYNRIEEFTKLKNFYNIIKKDENTALKNELKKIYKLGKTTYHVDICVPAVETSKAIPNLPTGPIDRYTLRKI